MKLIEQNTAHRQAVTGACDLSGPGLKRSSGLVSSQRRHRRTDDNRAKRLHANCEKIRHGVIDQTHQRPSARICQVDGAIHVTQSRRAELRDICFGNYYLDTKSKFSSGLATKWPRGLDNPFSRRTCGRRLNPHTHQKFHFCARLHKAAGLVLYICPGRPGAAS
jgi:hypothetical protein